EFTAQPDVHMPRQALVERLSAQTGEQHSRSLDAYHLAERLLGDSILSNMLMLGVAWQRGAIPLQHEAIERAIELNGVAVQANKLAFQVGRVWSHDPQVLDALLEPAASASAAAAAATGQRPETVQAALDLYM